MLVLLQQHGVSFSVLRFLVSKQAASINVFEDSGTEPLNEYSSHGNTALNGQHHQHGSTHQCK